MGDHSKDREEPFRPHRQNREQTCAPHDPEFERQMEIAAKGMVRYRHALQQLAKNK